MRGVAAILVVLYHAGPVTTIIAPAGYIAVDFFFALSGFVIAGIYEAKLRNGLSSPQRFAIIRLTRLYPLYLVGLLLGMAKAVGAWVLAAPHALTGSQIVLSTVFGLAILPTLPPLDDLFPLNGPAWSLFLEIAINIVFALWLVHWKSRSLVGLAALSALAMMVTVIHAQSLNVGWNWETLHAGFARVTFAFTMGVLLARNRTALGWKVSWAALIPITALILALCLPAPQQYRTMIDLVIALLICPAILYYGTVLECPLQLRPLASFLGDISYPVYAVHFPLLFMFTHVAGRAGLAGSSVLWVFMPCLIAGSALLYHLYDVPVRRFLSARRGAVLQPEIVI
ncbi:hypothetical protein BLM14_16250 [Phyllobacterium zundukense]|nr:acyltransferase [Phyllobacterium zundukense]ATU92988.1 hypothetical protein BLM14_16250 [Phyllobacterium zundukense]